MNIESTDTVRRVAVIGGGISGLAAAHRLIELAPSVIVTLYESQGRLGGVIRTEQQDGYLLEHGADMLTTKDPWALDLCQRIGLAAEMIGTNAAHRRAFVVHRGRLRPVPAGFTLMSPGRIWPMITTRILSPWGKLRLGWEYFVPPRHEDRDESLAEFTTRRLGREAYQRLVQPLVSGIYTADPTKLSMQAAMPQFVEMERKYGGLVRGMRQTTKQATPASTGSGARYDMFVAPRGGMGKLIEALSAHLPKGCVRLNHEITDLAHGPYGWDVTSSPGGRERYDAVVVAAPAYAAARLLRGVQNELVEELDQIPYAGTAILLAAYQRDQIAHALDGFGVVVPLCEQRSVLAISFSSIKFSKRAPEDHVLLRVFVGGASQAELLSQDDDQLRKMVLRELEELLGARGTPQLFRIIRWTKAMPQYHVGHVDRAARIDRLVHSIPRLALAGNAYRGVGVPFCVHSGEQAALRVLGHTDPYSKSTSTSFG